MAERKGVHVGIDVGAVQVGVARCGPDDILTTPIETLIRREDRPDIDRVSEIVDEFLAIEVIVSLPRHLKGGEGISAKAARRYTLRVRTLGPEVRVALVGERLTSNQAHTRLRASGISEKDHRPITDQVAAQIILEQALEEGRMSGRAPGKEITSGGSSAR